jgi:hypothetical protein
VQGEGERTWGRQSTYRGRRKEERNTSGTGTDERGEMKGVGTMGEGKRTVKG